MKLSPEQFHDLIVRLLFIHFNDTSICLTQGLDEHYVINDYRIDRVDASYEFGNPYVVFKVTHLSGTEQYFKYVGYSSWEDEQWDETPTEVQPKTRTIVTYE